MARKKHDQILEPRENRNENDRNMNMLKKAGVDIVFTYPNTLMKCLVKNNTRVIPLDAAPGIYEIPCGACPKKYIGETGRTLSKRLVEHKRDVKLVKSPTLALCI